MQGVHYGHSWAGAEASGGCIPRFYVDAVQDELATAQQGRAIFTQKEFVEIIMPGNQYSMPVHEVNDSHRQRWPQQYERFKQGLEMSVDGTPLEEWPPLNRAQVLELKAMKVHTIEQVAGLSDTVLQRIMGGFQLRAKARAFLDDAAASALVEQTTAENDKLKSEIAALRQQVTELGEMSQRMHGELMGLRNAPSPIATVVPGMVDPIQMARMQQHGMEPREVPQSSLATFAEERRKPGRPRKNAEEAA